LRKLLFIDKYVDIFALIGYYECKYLNYDFIKGCLIMVSKVFRGNILEALVPISRLNKGEVNKIFDEVRLSSYKVVVKNNVPACILLTLESYQEMLDIIDDQYLLALAEERLKSDSGVTYSFEEILAKDGLTIADIDAMEDVEIE